MVGELTDSQIDLVLLSQLIGRIGYHANGKMYITPITYVYRDGYIYAHSKEGFKIHSMRGNPNVCFQVDAVENMRNWRSVILWGKYEELTDEDDYLAAVEIMTDRFSPFVLSETVNPSFRLSRTPGFVEKNAKPVIYRINVTEKTGRFEKA